MKAITLGHRKRVSELNRVKELLPQQVPRRRIVSMQIENEAEDQKLKGLKHILVPIDFSEQSLPAVDFAGVYAEKQNL